ncbi:MAG: CaiB/BaiF CoA-transferase family protein [Spirochaetaceae bacterium]|nr:CaiB/BaiF CoA-transferase family protein [Spirochaetaceae bacterium]
MLPLSNYTVLDLTIARAGPTAVRLLADWGANVIKIEPPPGHGRTPAKVTGARHEPDEQNMHRNKRGLTIDLKNPAGNKLFMDLVTKADVVAENFRADVKHRLGVDYETVRKANPRIIYASISGFGQAGPYRDRPGVDQIVQGTCGLMSVTGHPGQGPVRAGIAISDTSAGMFLGQGILLALLHRERTGAGQWVHTSLLEAMLCKIDFQGARYTMSGDVPKQQGNNHPVYVPMGTFESKDGLVNLAANSPKMFANLCRATGAEHILDNPAFADDRARRKHRAALNEAVNRVTRNFTTAELVEKLNAAGVPCGPIYDIGEAFEDPQARHLRMTKVAHHKELGDVELIRSPINLSLFPHGGDFHHAAPDPGENRAEVLRDFGYDDGEIDRLIAAGAV